MRGQSVSPLLPAKSQRPSGLPLKRSVTEYVPRLSSQWQACLL